MNLSFFHNSLLCDRVAVLGALTPEDLDKIRLIVKEEMKNDILMVIIIVAVVIPQIVALWSNIRKDREQERINQRELGVRDNVSFGIDRRMFLPVSYLLNPSNRGISENTRELVKVGLCRVHVKPRI